MGTLSKVFIRTQDIEQILIEFEKYYTIRRREILDDAKWWYYFENETIIVSQNYNVEWVEIEFDFQGNLLYLYDEFLRRLSISMNSIILLGYYQSTTGVGRVAKFEVGKMDISIVQLFITSKEKNAIYLVDNFGVSDDLKEMLHMDFSKIGDEFSLIDYNFIYNFFEKFGLKSDNHMASNSEKYLHIEKLKA